jgi:hypothetical protein
MDAEEFEQQATVALLDALIGGGMRLTDETRKAMLGSVIKVMPPNSPVRWVESAKIENGEMRITLTPEAKKLLVQEGWGEIDAPQ